eukprot:GHVS01012473.1.p1 GENE.GHVS01012473.1~~GHVS01012473.1.p1  ORF type:complete len:159 (+),score=20.44 GHVS01012473.1:152-628(+)
MGKKQVVESGVPQEGDSPPLFKRFVQPGRLCTVEYGPDVGKLCFIVDIITLNRVLIDGGGITGVSRQDIPIRRLRLTDLHVPVGRGVCTHVIGKAVRASNIIEKFNETTVGKKRLLRELKAKMSDFDRFKLGAISHKRNKLANKHLETLMKTTRKTKK